MSGETTVVVPKRGGIHPLYGLYIGGSGLDQDYQPKDRNSYSYASQRRNVKTISSIERDLVTARDSTTNLKFDGRLEPVVTSTTEVGKVRFLTLLERRVEEHGQETFYHVKDMSDTVVNLFDHVHNFTLEEVVKEFNERSKEGNEDYAAFDTYEVCEVKMSRLVVESYLTSAFLEKIFVRYGHRADYKRLPGSCLLIMALETCNASVSHDINGAATAFVALTLDTYPGENVSDFSTEALRLIKIMQGEYALPVNTGSRLLQKVTRTSCEEFNRKVFNLLDFVKTMEHKYKVLDPRSLLLDKDYHQYGPVGVISTLQQIHGRLLSDHDWPALATQLPESNHADAHSGRGSRPGSSSSGADERKCFRCKGPHLIKDCPLKKKEKGGSDSEPAAKKTKTELPSWKYVEPKDLSKPVVDDDGRSWKFCTKCVCKKSGKTGLYLLSHFDADHRDDYASPQEGNLASVDDPHAIPTGVPEVTTLTPILEAMDDDDPMEFKGAWCAVISTAEVTRAFGASFADAFVRRPNVPRASSAADALVLALAADDGPRPFTIDVTQAYSAVVPQASSDVACPLPVEREKKEPSTNSLWTRLQSFARGLHVLFSTPRQDSPQEPVLHDSPATAPFSWFQPSLWFHSTLASFLCVITLLWKSMTYLCFGSVSDHRVGSSSRRSRRALARRLFYRRHGSFR